MSLLKRSELRIGRGKSVRREEVKAKKNGVKSFGFAKW